MFTQIKNGKRKCERPNSHIQPWDYLKRVLSDCGFAIEQTGSSKEYIMKGCEGQILIYVKFKTDTQAKVIFVSEGDGHDSLSLDWTLRSDFHKNGDRVMSSIRQVWFAQTKLP